jgi:hypothetical protein
MDDRPDADIDLDADSAHDDPDRVLARLQASAPRRAVGAAMLASLGGLLIYMALTHPPEAIIWLLFLLAGGAGVLWLSVRLWQASAVALELTARELREAGGGQILARLDEIETVARGVFAFKPSNGFLLTLRSPAPRHWSPGLWWRMGRRIGIGGVTPRLEARQMAEILDMELARRRRGPETD